MRIVAVVGTMPFPRLIEALAELRRSRPEVSIWAQHAGGGLADGLDGAPFEGRERLLERMRSADAVICHGGSGTVRDAIAVGQTPVVVPRLSSLGELVNDHQMEIPEAFGFSIVFVGDASPEALWDGLRAASGRRTERTPASPGRLASEIATRIARARHSLRTRVVWWILRVLTCWIAPRRLDPSFGPGPREDDG